MSVHAINKQENNNLARWSGNKAIVCLGLWVLANLSLILWAEWAKANVVHSNQSLVESGAEKWRILSGNFTMNKNLKFVKYEIKDKDTLSEIAEKYGVDTLDIKRFNKNINNIHEIFVWQKILIPVVNEEVGVDDTKKVVRVIEAKKLKREVKQQSPIVAQNQVTQGEIFTPKVIESIISDNENFNIFYEYWKLYHSKKIQKIQQSNYTSSQKRKIIIGLFLNDSEIYWKKAIIQQIERIKFEKWVSERISNIFKGVGYNIKANQIVELYSKIETSWWNYNYYFEKARAEKNQLIQEKLIKKAVYCAVWPDWDTWPFHITWPWLETEKKYWANINWNYIDNTDLLRRKVYMVFKTAIVNWYSQRQVSEVLKKIDIRFDVEKMGNVILTSFERLYNNFSAMWSLSEGEKIRLCTLAYNSWGWRANVIAKRLDSNKVAWIKWLNTIDNRKRINWLQVASLRNNLQESLTTTAKSSVTADNIVLASNKTVVKTDKETALINNMVNNSMDDIIIANNRVKTTANTSIKIVSLSDRVKELTWRIMDPNMRQIVQKKLEVDPIGKLSRSEQRYKDLAEKWDKWAKIRAIWIKKIVTDLKEYKKAA